MGGAEILAGAAMKAADADGPNRWVRDLLKDAELEPQPLPVVHSRDLAMVSTFMPDHGSAGLAYSVQTYANSIGIEAKQRKEFLERRLSVQNLGLAALQRAGWASIIPIAYDSLSGGDPLFDFRSSGLPSNAIFGNRRSTF